MTENIDDNNVYLGREMIAIAKERIQKKSVEMPCHTHRLQDVLIYKQTTEQNMSAKN